jgi:hypothetical protein
MSDVSYCAWAGRFSRVSKLSLFLMSYASRYKFDIYRRLSERTFGRAWVVVYGYAQARLARQVRTPTNAFWSNICSFLA